AWTGNVVAINDSTRHQGWFCHFSSLMNWCQKNQAMNGTARISPQVVDGIKLSMFTTYPAENGFLQVDTISIIQVLDQVGGVVKSNKICSEKLFCYVVHGCSPVLGKIKPGTLAGQSCWCCFRSS